MLVDITINLHLAQRLFQDLYTLPHVCEPKWRCLTSSSFHAAFQYLDPVKQLMGIKLSTFQPPYLHLGIVVAMSVLKPSS
jgi:hypothetical protein